MLGGPQMDVAFFIYGVLFLAAASVAFYYARMRKFKIHRRWAIRTFSLGIGSALYRIYVGPLVVDGHIIAERSQVRTVSF